MLLRDPYSVTIYSIIVTVKVNDLFVDNYLVYLMDSLSNLEDKSKNIDMMMKYIHWSSDFPGDVLFSRIKRSISKAVF